MYLSNLCSEDQSGATPIYPPIGTKRVGIVFDSVKDMHFDHNELVGCTNAKSIALFRLNKDDWHIAMYIVVAAKDVIVQDKIAQKLGFDIHLSGKRFLDEE